jgi:ribokinase
VRASILVAGSLNMDFVARVAELPAAGQTVTGTLLQLIPGGKGANQACAAGKLAGAGLRVRMAGCVATDSSGEELCQSLMRAGVDVEAVSRVEGVSTGAALINVDASGENTIVVVPGANARFEPVHAERLRGQLREASWVLLQLESPPATVLALLRAARQEGARTMLDPAPARGLSREWLSLVDILTPNASEACLLLGRPATRVGPMPSAQALLAMTAGGAVETGKRSCYYSARTVST